MFASFIYKLAKSNFVQS